MMKIKGLDQFLAFPKRQWSKESSLQNPLPNEPEFNAALPEKRALKKQRKPSIWTWILRGSALTLVGGTAFVVFMLPDMMSCGSKAILSESKMTVGSMNRVQQAYRLEHETFARDINALQLGIKSQTQNYDYSTRVTPNAAFNMAIARRDYTLRRHSFGPIEWQTRGDDLKGYVGAVFLVPATTSDTPAKVSEKTAIAILCEAIIPGAIPPAEPTYKNGAIACGAGTTKIR